MHSFSRSPAWPSGVRWFRDRAACDGLAAAPGGGDATIDYADYGDETIDTSPPPEAESAVDITDGSRELIGG